MLRPEFIRTNLELVRSGLRKRAWKEEAIKVLDEVIRLDDERKNVQTIMDSDLSKVNTLSSQVGSLYKSGKRAEADVIKDQVTSIKTSIKETQEKLHKIVTSLEGHLLTIPNHAHDSVPQGTSEEDNEVYKAWGSDLPTLDKEALAHWDIAEKYNIVDFKLGVKITGAGFPVFRGKGSKLQRALINFFLDEAIEAGYEEFVAPLLVNEESARGTGNLPDKEGQMYHCEKDNLYLIPTAELPLTNVHRNVILDEKDFPLKLTGYTPCFRREAGSYGSDVKGLNRVHQFDKIEIVQIEHPERSYNTQVEMLNHVESLLKKLELPYRILRLCGGDLTFASALTYDFEVYAAGQKRWLEVSSVSNFETYQSNRLKLRYKDQQGKKHLAHTLNGSALALARIIAALLENNQTKEGIKIPKVLVPYTGFEWIN